MEEGAIGLLDIIMKWKNGSGGSEKNSAHD
jgi:hypothetical protein